MEPYNLESFYLFHFIILKNDLTKCMMWKEEKAGPVKVEYV